MTRVVQEVLGPCPLEEPRAALWEQRACLVRAVFQEVRLDPQQGLQNGDRITVHLLYDASAAKDAGFRILDAQRQWVVRGLAPSLP